MPGETALSVAVIVDREMMWDAPDAGRKSDINGSVGLWRAVLRQYAVSNCENRQHYPEFIRRTTVQSRA
ncbi:unnamed protein product [Schistosoma curassoni]|uniref:Transposase n=1 Tax=Schistosoma curassoni TaxID=6186 RepID=A0A183JI91_9TREM|nr:unnamed protein product [Schistosoma curassoni]